MKKFRIYLDTSVFGGYFDTEFEEFTEPLFKRIADGEFIVLISTILDEELEFAPNRIKMLMSNLNDQNSEFLVDKDEAIDLATSYIKEKVVGKTNFADCLHIALATIYKADLLVSWNFKHIVNVERIRGYNSINTKNGYQHLEIRSPRDLIMETKTKKEFDAVEFAREQKNRLSEMFANMTKKEILEYLKSKSLERGRIKPDA